MVMDHSENITDSWRFFDFHQQNQGTTFQGLAESVYIFFFKPTYMYCVDIFKLL